MLAAGAGLPVTSPGVAHVKLSVMQENLARGLSVVSRAVSNRSTLPVLANVLLKTEDAGLKLTATNLEIGITYWVPGKIETDGATTVPAKLLTDLVNSLPSGDRVDLELQPGDTLHLRSGRFETHIKGIDADEFPAIRAAGERPTTRIAQNVLRRALAETAFAAASDEARPILTGVLARFEGDQLTLAAADNYRIAVKTIPILDPVEETSVVIPARALNELARILADVDDPVEVVLAAGTQPGPVPPRRHRPRQPAHRRPVPELPAGHAGEPRDAGRPRSRGAAARRPAGGAHRPRVGQHREAPDQRRWRARASRSAPTPRSATTSARSRPRSRATGRRSRSTPGTSPTCSTNVDADQFALELNGPLSPGVFKPVGDDRYVHVVMPVRTTS